MLKTRIQQPQNQKTGHLTHARKRTADWKVSILVRSLIELCLLLYFCVLSEKRVIDLKEEFIEYAKFFDSLKDTVQRSPVDEKVLNDALRHSGFQNPKEEILNLINIGVLKQYQRKITDSVRYHFPDIYLRGDTSGSTSSKHRGRIILLNGEGFPSL